MKKLIICIYILLLCSCTKEFVNDIIIDGDNNVYKSVTIGDQTWLQTNLLTTKYNNGVNILYITNKERWQVLESPAYCWYDNDETTYKVNCGALYNWYAVNTDKLCPIGYHVPTNADWNILINYLGDSAGYKLMNDLFLGPLGGSRSIDGVCWDFGSLGFWWAADEYIDPLEPNTIIHYSIINEAWYRAVHINMTTLFRQNEGDYHFYKKAGMSVRCIKD